MWREAAARRLALTLTLTLALTLTLTLTLTLALTLRLTLTAGPGGAVASTRSQARQGGKLPPVTQKPIGEMTLRELIAERSRGEPMQSSRSKVG